MSFANTDYSQIRKWLGYTANAQQMQTIRDRCTAAATADPEVVKQVRDSLRELSRIDQQRRSGHAFADRTLSSNAGGTNQRSPSFGRDYLREEIRRLVDEISQTLQLPVVRYPGQDSSGFRSSGKVVRA